MYLIPREGWKYGPPLKVGATQQIHIFCIKVVELEEDCFIKNNLLSQKFDVSSEILEFNHLESFKMDRRPQPKFVVMDYIKNFAVQNF
jgi:hypothetical protein